LLKSVLSFGEDRQHADALYGGFLNHRAPLTSRKQ